MSKFESNKYLYIYRQKNNDRCYIIDFNDKLLPPQSSYLKAFYFVDWYYIQNFQTFYRLINELKKKAYLINNTEYTYKFNGIDEIILKNIIYKHLNGKEY